MSMQGAGQGAGSLPLGPCPCDNGSRSGVGAVVTRTLYGRKILPMGVRALPISRVWSDGEP